MTASHSVTQSVAVKTLGPSQLQIEVSHMETEQKQKKKKCAEVVVTSSWTTVVGNTAFS